jgi:hypothetical protein
MCKSIAFVLERNFRLVFRTELSLFIYVSHMYVYVYVGLSGQARIWLSRHQ